MKRGFFLFAVAFAAFAAGPALPRLTAEGSGRGAESAVVLALGLSGEELPLEALGRADRAIRQVIADRGRYRVFELPQRLSQAEAEDLYQALVEARREGGPVHERRIGAASFTKTQFGRLLGASLVAIPLLSRLDSFYDDADGRWESDIEVSVMVIDPSSDGSAPTLVAEESLGYDEDDRDLSIAAALEDVPRLLSLKLREAGAFRGGARILASSEGKVELGVGRAGGARKGGEYALLPVDAEEPAAGETPLGLVEIGKVGPGTSEGRVVYSNSNIAEGASLEEVPRLGFDAEPYLRLIWGIASGGAGGDAPDLAQDPREGGGASAIVGLRLPVSRGFHGLRPYAAVQVPAGGVRGYGSAFLFPVDLLLGAEYRASWGRLSLVPYCGAGVGFVYASETIYAESTNSSDSVMPYLGGQAYVHLAFLASRDIRLFVELGGEYWISTVSDLYTDYGGVGFGAGVAIKL
jgi:hypothetical protein